jgi:hypothetical protein
MPADREKAIGDSVADWLGRARADLAVAQLTDDKRIAQEIFSHIAAPKQ